MNVAIIRLIGERPLTITVLIGEGPKDLWKKFNQYFFPNQHAECIKSERS